MSKAREWPGVGKCPAHGQCKICKCPTPGLTRRAEWPAVARGGWVQVELTDALEREDKNLKKTKLKTAGFSGEKRGVYFLG